MSNVFVFGKTCNDKKVDFNEEGEIKRLTESLLIYLCSSSGGDSAPGDLLAIRNTPSHKDLN